MTYNELWHQLTLSMRKARQNHHPHGDGSGFRLTLTDLYTGKVNEISSEEKTLLAEFIERLQKASPCSMSWGRLHSAEESLRYMKGAYPQARNRAIVPMDRCEYNRPYCGLQPPEPCARSTSGQAAAASP